MRHEPRSSCRAQRGAVALAVTLLLLFALLLGLAFANRDLVFEQRTSANQYRSTQAFEAAEAGLEWALAQLNNAQRLDADCRPSADRAASTFRERYLSRTSAASAFAPVAWNDAGVATALQAVCVQTAAGWVCSCPSNGAADFAALAIVAVGPAFSVRFFAGDKAGAVRATAVGCTALVGPCVGDAAAAADARAQLEAAFALLPGLRNAPAAALTARGTIDADAAAFGAHNRDPASGGAALHAGGAINASHARLTVPAGAAQASATVSHDAALAQRSAGQLFASYFGIDAAGWMSQPAVTRVDCRGNCAESLQRAIESSGAPALIAVDGDLRIDGPVALGSAERPIVIVASGAAQLHGAVELNGVIHAAELSWDDTAGGGALLRGAAISAANYRGDGAPDWVYDADVLARLKTNSGSFVRISGSWRDF